jgi:hypothetical protein
MEQYDNWKKELEQHFRLLRAGETPRAVENLEGSSSSHNWEEAYSRSLREDPLEDRVVTMSPLLYRLMVEQGHVSELENLQIRLRREAWLHYFKRILRRVLRIDQLP